MNSYFSALIDEDGKPFDEYVRNGGEDLFRFHPTTAVQILAAEYAKVLVKGGGRERGQKVSFSCELPVHADLSIVIFLRKNMTLNKLYEATGKAPSIVRREITKASTIFPSLSVGEYNAMIAGDMLMRNHKRHGPGFTKPITPKELSEKQAIAKEKFEELVDEFEITVEGDPTRPNSKTNRQPFFLPHAEEISNFQGIDLLRMKKFVSLEDRDNFSCAYPIGRQQGRQYYCGCHVHSFKRIKAGKAETHFAPYCEEHLKRMFKHIPRKYGGVGSATPTERANSTKGRARVKIAIHD